MNLKNIIQSKIRQKERNKYCILTHYNALINTLLHIWGLPVHTSGSAGKEPTSQFRRLKRCRLNPWVRKRPWRRKWQPTPVFLLGKSHEQWSLAGYSPRGLRELDTTEDTRKNINYLERSPFVK